MEFKGFFMLFSTSLIFAEHFGFNTNLLETNVLNLAVVLAVVVTYVGDALRGLLANRKQNILNNFQEAEQRASEAQERLNQMARSRWMHRSNCFWQRSLETLSFLTFQN
jgi:hypothetical protein